MGTVKTAFEKAMEKMEQIQGLTPEEKQVLRERDTLREVTASFYRGQLNRDQLWEKLKGIKPALLNEAQHQMIDSLRLGSEPEEMRQRKDGILAIEALKETKNSSAIENGLKSMESIQKEYQRGKEEAIKQLRAAIEGNPQLRMRQIRTPDGRVGHAAVSVDEAMRERLSEFLPEHEKRYEMTFVKAVEKLKRDLK